MYVNYFHFFEPFQESPSCGSWQVQFFVEFRFKRGSVFFGEKLDHLHFFWSQMFFAFEQFVNVHFV